MACLVILAQPDRYTSLIYGQFSASARIHLSVRIWIPARAIICSWGQWMAISHTPASVRLQFLKLICWMFGQWWAMATAISSVMSLRPAMVMVSRLGQWVTIVSTTLGNSFKREERISVDNVLNYHTTCITLQSDWALNSKRHILMQSDCL